MTTAGIIVIGNEILSGKVDDENARYMIGELRTLGVDLLRITVVRDDLDAIAHEVAHASGECDVVFTSGGVGATHDDITMEGVARAFGAKVIRNPELETRLREHYQDRINDEVLRMADVPDGAILKGSSELLYPIVSYRNVYILPGVPMFFKAKFDYLKSTLAGDPVTLRQLFLSAGEGDIAAILLRAQNDNPTVEIGSYPRFDIDEYRVKVTVESRDAAAVDQVVDRLVGELGSDVVIRVD